MSRVNSENPSRETRLIDCDDDALNCRGVLYHFFLLGMHMIWGLDLGSRFMWCEISMNGTALKLHCVGWVNRIFYTHTWDF